jgi:hypothetical protein
MARCLGPTFGRIGTVCAVSVPGARLCLPGTQTDFPRPTPPAGEVLDAEGESGLGGALHCRPESGLVAEAGETRDSCHGVSTL